jgi:hypothetical protein
MASKRRVTSVGLKREVHTWAEKIGVAPKELYVQRMTRKWASCSTRGRICFSTDLLCEERRFRSVVIVHELIHLMVPNHGKLFKSLMNAYMPDWERIAGGRVSRMCGFVNHGPGARASGGRRRRVG